MADVVRILIAVFIFGASVGYGQAAPADYAVSPESAKKAAVYRFVTTYDNFLRKKGYEYFFISEPEVISSLRGERKWYSYYIVAGTRAGKHHPVDGRIVHIAIPTSKRYYPAGGSGHGMPPELASRFLAEERIREATGGRTAAFTGIHYCSDRLQFDTLFAFEINGRTYVLAHECSYVSTADGINREPEGDPDKYLAVWERIDEEIPSVVLGGDKIFVRDISNNIGQ
jgi:hypothetical protein